MRVFRQVKHAAVTVLRERVVQRIALTATAATLGFVIGVLLPWHRVLVGATVATLLVIIVQVIVSFTEDKPRSSAGDVLQSATESNDQP